MPKPKRIDLGLKLLQQAFNLKALHFGLFTEEMPRTPDGVHLAQEEYTRTICSLIPEGVKSVLDVGSGLGGTSKRLAEAGLSVEGLSPDPYHGEQFGITCGPEVPFNLTGFEDFSPGKTYDCLLFGESPQYIAKDAFFPKCLELTEPGGHLVVAELFQVVEGGVYDKCFFEDDFVARAERAGFQVAQRLDITENVLPSLEVGRLFLKYGQRLFEFGTDSARRRRPFLWWLLRIPWGRKIDHVGKLLQEKLPYWLDEDRFRATTRYVMYRLSR